jgi:hypothetical protein
MSLPEPELPQSPSKVFALATPHHLLIKLHWEIRQLRIALETEQPVALTHVPAYHAFNCAVTCWHLTDWTWEYVDEQTRLVIAEQLGTPLTSLERFQQVLRDKHRPLRVCWQLCNGSKHFRLNKDDPDIQTQDVWEHRPLRAGQARAGHSSTYQYRLVLTDKGEPVEALALFQEAEKIWIRELGSWFVIEGQSYIEGKPIQPLTS